MTARFLSRFTPSLMSPEDLEAVFVQRQELATRIVELIRESALTEAKHYTLLIGPRGIGKTHLVSVVYHRIYRMDDLRDRLLIAWLREEEWGVTSLLDLFLRIFRALGEGYRKRELADRVDGLYELPADTAQQLAGERLKEYLAGRTLLLLVENLDNLFAGLGSEGQKRLRSYIQENPFFTILATSPSLFDGVRLQTSPFYGFFRNQHLEELDVDTARDLLARIASHRGDQELADFLQTPSGRARIRAVHHLAGGNHRVYVIFSAFVTRESLDELVEPVIRTLDELTPYYQQQMNWLSQQQRKIVQFLCDQRRSVQVKEIAQRCFISHQTASAQLRTLREMAYVRSIPVGRESYYELREPLMRYSLEVKEQRGQPASLLIDFLRVWYSRKELEQQLTALGPDSDMEREYLQKALEAAKEAPEDPRVVACVRDVAECVQQEDFQGAMQPARELTEIRGHESDWLIYSVCLASLARRSEALQAIDEALNRAPELAVGWALRGWLLREEKRHEEAAQSFDRAIVLDSDNAFIWEERGDNLLTLGRWDEALEAFDRALTLDENAGRSWSGRGTALIGIGRPLEALSAFEKAIEHGYVDSFVLMSRAVTLGLLDRWDDCISALDEALSKGDTSHQFLGFPTKTAVACLLMTSVRAQGRRARITSLLDIYARHDAVTELAHALLATLPSVASPTLSDQAVREWRQEWTVAASQFDEFELPLRVLDVAVRYREQGKDNRVLLELPSEEREFIKQAFEQPDE